MTAQTNAVANRHALGPFRPIIVERLAVCADHLGRLTGSLALDFNPDRFPDMIARAYVLRDAADLLIDRCHDVENWLKQGGAELPDDSIPPAERAYLDAQKLGRGVYRIGDWLAALPWYGPPEDDGSEANRILRAVAAELHRIRTLGQSLERSVANLRAGSGG